MSINTCGTDSNPSGNSIYLFVISINCFITIFCFNLNSKIISSIKFRYLLTYHLPLGVAYLAVKKKNPTVIAVIEFIQICTVNSRHGSVRVMD